MSIKFLPSGLRKPCGRKVRTALRARGDGKLQGSKHSIQHRTNADMNSQRPWQCGQNVHGYVPDGVPALGEVDMVHIPNPETVSN